MKANFKKTVQNYCNKETQKLQFEYRKEPVYYRPRTKSHNDYIMDDDQYLRLMEKQSVEDFRFEELMMLAIEDKLRKGDKTL